MKCPKCGQGMDTTGRAPGSRLTCGSCGNVTAVPAPKSRKALYVVLGLGAVAMSCPCIGVVAAIAIPNFIRYQGRAQQVECKTNLKSWYTGQKYFQSENDRYSLDLDEVGFAPERGNRYAYFVGPGPLEQREGPTAPGVQGLRGISVDTAKHMMLSPFTFEQLPEEAQELVGANSQCTGSDCELTLLCAGNLDKDETLDIWTISTEDRTGADGVRYPAGEPVHNLDDLQH